MLKRLTPPSSFRLFSTILGVLALGAASSQALERIDLTDYKPPQGEGSTWVYSRTDKKGAAESAATRITVEDNYFLIKQYDNLGQWFEEVNASKYAEERGTLVKGKFVPLKGKNAIKSFLYYRPGGGYRFYGLDQIIPGTNDKVGNELRITEGFTLPRKAVVGQGVRQVRRLYGNGKELGDAFFKASLLGIETVKVPAGTFKDCAHVRLQLGQGPDADVGEEWWARGVGLVKWVGISGTGKGITEKLVSMDLKDFIPFKAPEIQLSGSTLLEGPSTWHTLHLPAYVWGGPPVSTTFTITNGGTETLKDLSLEMKGGKRFFSMEPSGTRDLEGGESVTITVTFSSATPTFEASSLIRITSSDPHVDETEIHMSMYGF